MNNFILEQHKEKLLEKLVDLVKQQYGEQLFSTYDEEGEEIPGLFSEGQELFGSIIEDVMQDFLMKQLTTQEIHSVDTQAMLRAIEEDYQMEDGELDRYLETYACDTCEESDDIIDYKSLSNTMIDDWIVRSSLHDVLVYLKDQGFSDEQLIEDFDFDADDVSYVGREYKKGV